MYIGGLLPEVLFAYCFKATFLQPIGIIVMEFAISGRFIAASLLLHSTLVCTTTSDSQKVFILCVDFVLLRGRSKVISKELNRVSLMEQGVKATKTASMNTMR